VAGVAAQIRQYFVKFNSSVITNGCRYFTGTGTLAATTCDQLSNPRGATVKALVIQSGEQMSQYSSVSSTVLPTTNLGSTPDVFQVGKNHLISFIL
jgi:hypothetical protein